MKRLSALALIAIALTGCTTAEPTRAPIITNSPTAEPTSIAQVITSPVNKPKLTAQQDELLRSKVLAVGICHQLDMITANQAARAIHSIYRGTTRSTGVVIERELQTEVLTESLNIINADLIHPTTHKRMAKNIKPICDAINKSHPR